VAEPGPLVPIEDPTDPRLTEYRDLTDQDLRRRIESEHAIMVVEGRLAVERLVDSGHSIRSLLVDDHQLHSSAGLVAAVRTCGAPVYVGSRPVVAATVGFNLHRGVVAVADRPASADAASVLLRAARSPTSEGRLSLVAVLEGLNDHENIGAVFRNAAAFGVGAVLLDPSCADPLYRRSIRVSMGHVLRVPFARLTPWPEALELVRDAGYLVAALSPHPEDGSSDPPAVTLGELASLVVDRPAGVTGVALVLGAEGPGLSAATLAASDRVVRIPMAQGADSLNVATAAAVAFDRVANP